MSTTKLSTRAPRWPGTLFWAAAGAVPLAFLAVFFFWPTAQLVVRGFLDDDGAWHLSAFVEVFAKPRTWRVIGQTLFQATTATLLSVVLALPGAHLLYRRRFAGQRLIRGLITVPFVLPSVVVGMAFRSLFSGPLAWTGLDGTVWAIIAALVFFNYALVVRTVGAAWQRLDPRPYQAARLLGAGPVRAFFTITLPRLAPMIGSAASLVFLFCATSFGTVLMLGGMRTGTVETEIWLQTMYFLDLEAAAVLSIVQLVVVCLALALAGRSRRRRETSLSRTGSVRRATRLNLRSRADQGALALTALVSLALSAPILTLVIRSLKSDGGWSLANYRALGSTGGGALTVTAWEAAGNSLRTAVLATVLALIIGLLVSLVTSRRPRNRWGRSGLAGLDALAMLPLGVSAVTVGFGYLITFGRPPLGPDTALGAALPWLSELSATIFDVRNPLYLIALAQAVVAAPMVMRTVLPVLRSINPRQREVAATLGAPPRRVLRTIDLPVAARALGVAVGFAFAVSLGEFGATSFLSRPDVPTLPTIIYRLLNWPGADTYGMALAASVVLAAITAGIMMLAEQLRSSQDEAEL